MHAGMEDQMVANHNKHTLAVSDEIRTHDLRITTTDQCVLHTYGQQQTQLLERHVGNLSSAVMSTITLVTERSHNTLLKHV